ncbi:MAG: hypothetical protein AAF757_08285 [Cyanobacteria bacterium P01_D01_bin.116]
MSKHTIITKKQSYLILTLIQVIILFIIGFEDYSPIDNYPECLSPYASHCGHNTWKPRYDESKLSFHILGLYLWNLLLFLGLFTVVLPHRKAVREWASFRSNQINHHNITKKSLIGELLLGEKSPATLAIAINLLIASITFFIIDYEAKINGSLQAQYLELTVPIFIGLIMIYASVAQIMLMLKSSKRVIWAIIGVITGVITTFVFPYLILYLNTIPAVQQIMLSLSIFASIQNFILFLFSVVVLLNLYLIKQVKSSVKSASR